MKPLIALALLTCLAFPEFKFEGLAQEEIKTKTFNTTTSTVFSLMGVAPATINRFSTIRDFRVDWVMNGMQIQRNIAIETTPIWMLGFSHVNVQQYDRLPWIVRKLVDTSLAVGTARVGTNDVAGISLNLNLLSLSDLKSDKEFKTSLYGSISDSETEWSKAHRQNLLALAYAENSEQSNTIQSRINVLESKISAYESSVRAMVHAELDKHYDRNWNAPFINVGYGFTVNYLLPDDYSSFTYLTNNHSVWLHWGAGIGSNSMIMGMARVFIGSHSDLGLNFRFGKSDKKSFFIEPLAVMDEKFVFSKFVLNVGGNLDITPKIFVGIGLRNTFGSNFNYEALRPSMNVHIRI